MDVNMNGDSSSVPLRLVANMNHSHIPIPKISSNSKLHDKLPLVRHDSMEKNSGRLLSVAAQRAAFEKLEAAASQQRRSNTNGPFLENQKNVDNKYTFNKKLDNGAMFNRSDSFAESKWKTKYDESEKRRKMVLLRSETVNKELADLDKKYQLVQNENKKLVTNLNERELELQKLRTVSEAVCKEYEQLKRQYDIETGAMHKAMQQASEWYKQNRQLKRQSQILAQKMLLGNPGELSDMDFTDNADTNDDDAEQLRETIRELSEEVAKLQTELSAARLQEFEAQEQTALLTSQLEEERSARKIDNEKLRELQLHKDNVQRVSKLVTEEVQNLKEQCDRERENMKLFKMEADQVQKERNVLAHQSALLMAEVGDDPNGRVVSLLQEVENLKRNLEEEQQNHLMQMQMLQEQLEEKESNVEFEIVEEKLKLAESELEMVVERAERAEKEVDILKSKLADLEERKSIPPVPPPSPVIAPPPPPPPPPFLPLLNKNQSSISLIKKERRNAEQNSAVSDMENMLGISKKNPNVPQQPAIDDIINQIKGGRFTLKHTDKQKEEERKRKEEAESTPAAVSEMLNILGTMRRRAKPKQSPALTPNLIS